MIDQLSEKPAEWHNNNNNQRTKKAVEHEGDGDTYCFSYTRDVHQGFDKGGARGVIVIVVRNEHGDTSSNPGRDWLHFT